MLWSFNVVVCKHLIFFSSDLITFLFCYKWCLLDEMYYSFQVVIILSNKVQIKILIDRKENHCTRVSFVYSEFVQLLLVLFMFSCFLIILWSCQVEFTLRSFWTHHHSFLNRCVSDLLTENREAEKVSFDFCINNRNDMTCKKRSF